MQRPQIYTVESHVVSTVYTAKGPGVLSVVLFLYTENTYVYDHSFQIIILGVPSEFLHELSSTFTHKISWDPDSNAAPILSPCS